MAGSHCRRAAEMAAEKLAQDTCCGQVWRREKGQQTSLIDNVRCPSNPWHLAGTGHSYGIEQRSSYEARRGGGKEGRDESGDAGKEKPTRSTNFFIIAHRLVRPRSVAFVCQNAVCLLRTNMMRHTIQISHFRKFDGSDSSKGRCVREVHL